MSTTLGLLDGPALAHALHLHPGTIRNWAHQGRLERRGTDEKGRATYDLEEAFEVSQTPRHVPELRAGAVGTTMRQGQS